jgi:hypothetical protein
MALFDTFYILFSTDAEKAKQDVEGLDAAAVKAAESVDKIGAVDTAGVEALADGMSKAAASAPALNDAATAAGKTASELGKAGGSAAAVGAAAGDAANKLNAAGDAAKKTGDAAATAKTQASGLADGMGKAANEAKGLGTAAGSAAGKLDGAAGAARRIGTGAGTATGQVRVLDRALDQADRTAANLGQSFLGAVRNLAGPVLALFSAGAVKDLVTSQATKIRELDQAATKLNSSIGNVDAFQRAIRNAGGETNAAIDSLTKIGEKVNEAFSDKESGARKDFKEWGLAFQATKGQALGAVDAMVALAGNLEKVSRAEALARIKKLGIEDATTIDLLLQGRKAVEARLDAEKRLGVATEAQARLAREYQRELGRTQSALERIGDTIMAAVLPAFTSGLQVFQRVLGWLGENKVLVQGFFIGVGAAITAFYLPAIKAAAAATIVATWPFLAIGAAIAAVGVAFALAYEDVQAFMNGQPSLIGELVKEYEWFAAIVEGIGAAFGYLKELASSALSGISEAWANVTAAFADAWPTIKAVFDNLLSGGQSILDFFVGAYEPILTAWSNLFSALGELASAIIDRIIADAGRIAAPWVEKFAAIKQTVMDTFRDMGLALEPFEGDIKELTDFIKGTFEGMAILVRELWKAMLQAMADGVQWLADKIMGIVSSLKSGITVPVSITGGGGGGVPFSPGPPPGSPEWTKNLILPGKAAIAGATNNPMGAATPGSITPPQTTVNRETTVNVGGVTIKTEATDAKGIASAVKSEIASQTRQALTDFDDGVDR